MIGTDSGRLTGSEIHGFHTMRDLDVPLIMEEAKTRWLRPNEIHAILSNYKYFTINAKPINLPEGGRIIFYDRKMLRNFRKDGHNWKKKKDGKTVKEAHEHLKVGDEERIHVYYAHGEDSPTFVRRCYWLLDKTLEHIVLVHYRETQELQGSPEAPVNSGFCSSTHLSAPWPVAEESNSTEPGSCVNVKNHEKRLHEINTLEWDDLLTSSDISTLSAAKVDNVSYANQQQQFTANGSIGNANACDLSAEASSHGSSTVASYQSNNYLPVLQSISSQPTGYELDPDFQKRGSGATFISESMDLFVNDGPKSDDSFGIWLNSAIADSPVEVDDPALQVAVPGEQDSYGFPAKSLQSFMPEQIFNITDVSHAWAYSTEKTKILITGYFQEGYQHLGKSNLFCICGDSCIPAEMLHVGVYRCFLPPHHPGIVSLYLSCDGQMPISHVLNFEYRTALSQESVVSQEEKSTLELFQLQLRLAHLLFSSKSLNVLANKVSPRSLQGAKKFAEKTSRLSSSWTYLMKSVMENQIPFEQAKDNFVEITLKNRLKEWLMEKMLEDCKTTEYDSKGQGVIHLCAILGYTWSVHMFSCSGFSLNFRDKFGWTALHWAAYYGREKMVAALLSAGARPNLVTDPTKQHPGGRTAADLALEMGYEGLAAYLSEKSLVAQFKDMKIAGNIRGTLQTNTNDAVDSQNLTEDEQNLKESLAAYRTAAEAAARIQEAFREHALKVQTKAISFASPEEEAKNIVAALKIQHAFRKHETRKRMAAAARIQQRFHTWKLRKEFLNMRRQTIRIQAAFRAFQARKHYRKIVWSVGVLEKAIFRWRLKRKGIRGVQVDHCEEAEAQNQESDTEEAFYKTSQKQAEERYDRAVVTVQSMFRSKQAQLEYRRMKFVHNQALAEYDCLQELDAGMEI